MEDLQESVSKLYDALINDQKELVGDLFVPVRDYIKSFENLDELPVSLYLNRVLTLFLIKRKFNDEATERVWVARNFYLLIRTWQESCDIEEQKEAIFLLIAALKSNSKHIAPLIVSTFPSSERERLMNTSQLPETDKKNFVSHFYAIINYLRRETNGFDYLLDKCEWCKIKVNNAFEATDKSDIDFGEHNGYDYFSKMKYWLSIRFNEHKATELKKQIFNSRFQASNSTYEEGMNFGDGPTTATIDFCIVGELIKVFIRGIREDLLAPAFEWLLAEYQLFADTGYVKIIPSMWGSSNRKNVEVQANEASIIVDEGKISYIKLSGISKNGRIFEFCFNGSSVQRSDVFLEMIENNNLSPRNIIGEFCNFNIDEYVETDVNNDYLPISSSTTRLPFVGEVAIVGCSPSINGNMCLSKTDSTEYFIIPASDFRIVGYLHNCIRNYDVWNPDSFDYRTVVGYLDGGSRKIHIDKRLY